MDLALYRQAAFPSSLSIADAARQSLVIKPILVENQITVLDIRSMMHERFDRHRQAVGVLLERCYARIRRCASVNRTDCIYEVPTFIPGLPLFDQATCIDAIIAHLARNGFTVTRSGVPGDPLLTISWSVTSSPVTSDDCAHEAAEQRQQQLQQQQQHLQRSGGGRGGGGGGLRSIAEFRPKRFRG